MPLFSRKNKEKLIGGLIGVFLVLLGLIVKSFFEKDSSSVRVNSGNKSVSKPVNISPKISDNSNTLTQHNQNKGNVSNDFSRDKRITNNFHSVKKEKHSDTIIQNNGFLNQGGQGNTYNQTFNPPDEQRHLSENNKAGFVRYINSNKFYFSITVYNFDKESIIFGKEISQFLKEKGGILEIEPFGENLSGFPDGKKGLIDWEVSPDGSEHRFVIYPLH